MSVPGGAAPEGGRRRTAHLLGWLGVASALPLVLALVATTATAASRDAAAEGMRAFAAWCGLG